MFFPRAERQARGGGGFQLYAILPDASQSNTMMLRGAERR
jgi:hypothetical protein